ncbi:MAG: prephenate dehydrogenase/arogenate dehydrogenase family protein [Lachnospiraceae bacterium]
MKDFQAPQHIGFIGLGLIGGSIAKTIRKQYPDCMIAAYDTDVAALHTALRDGCITQIVTSIEQDFSDCDIVFLCTPVHYNIEYLTRMKASLKDTCILTDVGSVKSDICEAITQLGMDGTFVGGHPMVGSEKSGYRASSSQLLENAYYFLTPTANTNAVHLDYIKHFIETLGAISVIFTPEEHDQMTASISHIPHIIASGLVNLVRKKDDEHGTLKMLAAGGFKDITRIASSSPTVWQHICFSNPTNICHQIQDFIDELSSVKTAIEQKEEQVIFDYFQEASIYRDSVPNKTTGVISKVYEVYADIADLPGELAKVTALLAHDEISISNIGIVNNREYQNGALRIELRDHSSRNQTIDLLTENGYHVFSTKQE